MRNDSIARNSAANQPGTKRPKRIVSGAVRVLRIVVLWLAAYALYEIAQNNFDTVVPGQVYRSSRMNPDALARVIQTRHIQSVLSLIGPSLIESNAVRKSGAVYFDVSISDRHELAGAQMGKIIAAMRAAPKPQLIHCKAGADRSGLASALYCFAIDGQTAEQADRQLTVWYGHVPLIRPKVITMDNSFWRYVTNHLPPVKSAENVSADANR